MANGNHALQLVESPSPPAPADKPVSEIELGDAVASAATLVEPALAAAPSNGTRVVALKPAAAPIVSETVLGDAVASATVALCCAVIEFQNGNSSPEAKMAVAERTTRLALMQLGHEGSDADFTQAARDAAKPVLRRALDHPEYLQRFSAAQADAALDVWVGETLTFVGHLVDTEREFVRTMAH